MVQVSGDTLGIMTDRDLRPTAGGHRPTPFAFSLPSIHCAQWTLTHWRTLENTGQVEILEDTGQWTHWMILGIGHTGGRSTGGHT